MSALLRPIPLVVALLLGPQGRPDPDESLESAVERIVGDREEEFVLARQQTSGTSTIQIWTPRRTAATPTPTPTAGEGRRPLVQIQIFRLSSDREAREQLERGVRYTQLSPVGSIDSLGDQSFLFLNGVPKHDYASIRFRKANVMVVVSADGRKLAERFAFHVLAAIEDRLEVSHHGLIAR